MLMTRVVSCFSLAICMAACGPTIDEESDPSVNPGGKGDSAGVPPDGMPDDPPDDPETDLSEPLLAIDVSHWTRTLTDPDIDCFWDLGYRHVVVGTQRIPVTREQLEISLRGGMTVDLYVYLYWQESVEEQMQEAVDLIAEFPEIGRVWIDVEEDPAGRSGEEIAAYVQETIDYMEGFPVGIYTGKGFWDTHMDGSEEFSDLPLWYARYDDVASLDTYSPSSSHAFGGWLSAIGKQFDDHSPATCGRAVDKNVMIRNVLPELVVDREPVPDDGDPPDVLVGLWPDNDILIETDYIRPTAIPSREATGYEIAIEHWNGTAFRSYMTMSRSVADLTFFPVLRDRPYRWRIRAENVHGFGEWTDWATFYYH